MTKTTVTTIPALYVAPVRIETDHLPTLDTADLPSNIFWRVLGQAVTLKRDYGSATEAAFVAWLTRQVHVTMVDAAGNLHVDTRTLPAHRSMFTAHTDTVHSSGGPNTVRVDGKYWRADKGAALGADDGSGCALLAYMIEMGVPGYFVFFRGEECGGIGSKWLAEEMPGLFSEIDRAIAFDRADYYDVITHQAGGRCCSDTFAQALADKLSTDDNWYMPCDTGVYTDTAEFIGLIPECTNISVGYKHQHGDREWQDVEFLWKLAGTCVSIQWDLLPTERDPKVTENKYDDWFSSKWDKWNKEDKPVKKVTGVYYGYGADVDDDDTDTEYSDDATDDLLDMIADIRTGSSPIALMYLIADEAWPEDPEMALKNMSARLLDDEALEYAQGMLEENWPPEAVLLELYNLCATT